MKINSRLRTAVRFVGNLQHLDKLCVVLAFIMLVYELQATVITDIGASFGLYDYVAFYSYRVKFAIFVVVVGLLNFIINHRYVFKDRFFLLYLFFVFYMVSIIWLNRDLYGAKSPSDPSVTFATTFWFPILFKYILFFIIGFYLPRFEKFSKLFILILLFSSGMILFYVDLETMGLDTKNYIDKSFLGNYLFIGDATALAALISLAFIKTNKIKILLTLFWGTIIFFIGSRTSFAVFAATTFLYFIISFKPKFLIASVIGIIAIGVALQNVDYTELEARNPRMFGVLVDYQGDNSVAGRQELEEAGLKDISDSLVLGKFGGQLDAGLNTHNSSWRAYIHGVLSYWRQFGILAMVIIVAFAIRFCLLMWKHLDKRDQSIYALYFLTALFLCVEAALSRSFAFTYTHLFFGLTVSLKYTFAADYKSYSLAELYYQTRPQPNLFNRGLVTKGPKKKRRSKNKSMRFG